MTSFYGSVCIKTDDTDKGMSVRIYDGNQDVTPYFDGVLGHYNRRDGLIVKGQDAKRFDREVRPALCKVIGVAVA
jgi:hypothetical protein